MMAPKNPKVSTIKTLPSRPLSLTSPKQRQGSYFEQLACAFLQQQGLQLLACNWQQPRVGEIDLIMIEKGRAWSTLVFIEVRQRQRSSFGDAALSVTVAKQRKIIKTARYFLQQHPVYADYECRFDVMAYDVDKNNSDKKSLRHSDISNLNSINNLNNNSSNNNAHQPEWLIGAFTAPAW